MSSTNGQDNGVSTSTSVSEHNNKLINWAGDSRYTVHVHIGTPGVDHELLVDTGSSTMWVFGENCTSAACEASTTKYEQSHSSTANVSDSSPYNITYAAGATKGQYVRDVVSVGPFEVTNFKFGVVNQAGTAPFHGTNISGLLGMGRNAAAITSPPFFYTFLANHDGNSDIAPQFGLHMSRNTGDKDPYKTEAINGGSLTLGGWDESLTTGDVTWVDVVNPKVRYANGTDQQDKWTIASESLSVNGHSVNLAGCISLMDSGSPGLGLPLKAVTEFYEQIPGASYAGEGLFAFPCRSVPQQKVSITFGGRVFWIQSTDLVLYQAGGTCIGSVTLSPLAQAYPNFVLVGAAFLKNFYTIHQTNPPRVGFVDLKPEFNRPLTQESIKALLEGRVGLNATYSQEEVMQQNEVAQILQMLNNNGGGGGNGPNLEGQGGGNIGGSGNVGGGNNSGNVNGGSSGGSNNNGTSNGQNSGNGNNSGNNSGSNNGNWNGNGNWNNNRPPRPGPPGRPHGGGSTWSSSSSSSSSSGYRIIQYSTSYSPGWSWTWSSSSSNCAGCASAQFRGKSISTVGNNGIWKTHRHLNLCLSALNNCMTVGREADAGQYAQTFHRREKNCFDHPQPVGQTIGSGGQDRVVSGNNMAFVSDPDGHPLRLKTRRGHEEQPVS
ncbi:endopeptidase [Trichosporon asahii var. asahii CBS 2479]|uniref:Endopeptidase n=1 Tax=Trichosporon asahii var. asahii (strain ATCC 90039 / CBS 2479 / JCM 2466 / KCTC 7840 / NBRC 103889/ NCYC 2677 / UAMH 7654) TaxID=1186058 RepID=J4UJG7_TRIAS|nr:endopeptidase [Trichosporon asahii var. asahii CBS 2479]EJT51930.1 endopeptidase [Trichosporon asahii var. asahii CBS 2479]